MSNDDTARQAALHEVQSHLPGLMFEQGRLLEAGIEPTGILLPSRLNVPFDGPDATGVRATCLGMPVTWSDAGQWGMVVALPTPRPT